MPGFERLDYITCSQVAKEYGKWPHEVLLSRNDTPRYVIKPHPDNPAWWVIEAESHFDVSLGLFDIQCLNFHNEEMIRQSKNPNAGSGKEF